MISLFTMKFCVVALFCVISVSARSVTDVTDFSPHRAFSRELQRAEEIRKYEESHLRIAGGQLAGPGAVPYQAGLLNHYDVGNTICGGTLLSTTRVFTAAHCWFDGWYQALSITVVLGSTTIFTGGTRITTSDIVMHPNWDPNTIRNDVAFIRIPSVTLSNLIATVALPTVPEYGLSFVGYTATLSGFGLTGDGHQISTTQSLSWVQSVVITNDECMRTFPNNVQPTNICTSGAGGRNSCSSDSGGPVVLQSNGRTILVGVVSFGSSAGCEQGYPAAHARVTSFIDFIYQYL